MMFGILVAILAVIALVLAQRLVHFTLMRMKRLAGRQKSFESMFDVIFVHPDLGLGGAERLVVDAVVGLQSHQRVYKRLRCTIVTNHHDPSRAFQETRDGTIHVVVRGSWLPRHVAHRALVLCATVRMLFAAVVTCVLSPRTDAFVVDQVSAVVPVIKLLCPVSSVLFYCHFPDQLCDPSRANQSRRTHLHQLYRAVFDRIEALTMQSADSVVCNSKFSRGVTVATFPSLASRIDTVEDIFYPPICVEAATAAPKRRTNNNNPFHNKSDEELAQLLSSKKCCFVSLNRYERKKNISLAIKGFALLVKRLKDCLVDDAPSAGCSPDDVLLVVAGGFDPRLAENVAHYQELMDLAANLEVIGQCVFLRSIENSTKHLLLSKTHCCVYTPSGEHFGIVPIEAMAFGKVVLAVRDGGPLESVTDTDRYGFLRAPEPQAFSEVMERIALDISATGGKLIQEVGAAAKMRCEEHFSLNAFSTRLMQRLLKLRSTVTDEKLKSGQYGLKAMLEGK